MPVYEFEALSEGLRRQVQAMGLRGTGDGRSKKEAKVVWGGGVGVGWWLEYRNSPYHDILFSLLEERLKSLMERCQSFQFGW